jgi:GST-like protein
VIDLYLWTTSNGLRASVALAECGLEHRIHKVNLGKGESRTPEFLRLNPAGTIPVIVDHDGPGGRPLTLAQSGAIIVYACEKAGRFIPTEGRRRALAAQYFAMAASDIAMASGTIFRLEALVPEKSAANVEYFRNQFVGYFRLVDRHLAGREFLADEISFADLMLYPNYAARRALLEEAGDMPHLGAWAARMAARPGVQRGMNP